MAKRQKKKPSVSDYMGSQNRVGRSEFFFWGGADFVLVDSSPYGRIFVITCICEPFICQFFLFINFVCANNSVKKNRVALSN